MPLDVGPTKDFMDKFQTFAKDRKRLLNKPTEKKRKNDKESMLTRAMKNRNGKR
jgi:hypothetical protein